MPPARRAHRSRRLLSAEAAATRRARRARLIGNSARLWYPGISQQEVDANNAFFAAIALPTRTPSPPPTAKYFDDGTGWGANGGADWRANQPLVPPSTPEDWVAGGWSLENFSEEELEAMRARRKAWDDDNCVTWGAAETWGAADTWGAAETWGTWGISST
ncbi:hypothetical protein C8R47DRAFT_1227528 [Mycena vitilis]|nr:hypothetical protein C8R47DRAFT_1227528 [Mycena vitilis]